MAQFSLEFTARGLEDIARLRKALEDPTPLMKQIGMLMVSASQKAFREQRYGGKDWPPRYPGQEPPKFNIAGALADWKSGRRSPKPVRFQDRPALVDEGMRGGLWGSISYKTDGKFGVSVGTTKDYAQRHQFGGASVQGYDEATKERIRAWLYQGASGPTKGKMKRVKYKKGRQEYKKHVAPLLRKNVLVTRINARPFIGMHEQLAQDILRRIHTYFRMISERGAQ